jgi:hypothetical protein
MNAAAEDSGVPGEAVPLVEVRAQGQTPAAATAAASVVT